MSIEQAPSCLAGCIWGLCLPHREETCTFQRNHHQHPHHHHNYHHDVVEISSQWCWSIMAHFSLVETCSQNLQKTLFSFRLFAHTVLSIHSRAPFFVTFRRGMRRTRVGCEQCERSRRQNPTIPRVGHHTTHCFSSTWRRRRQNPTISRGGHLTMHCFSST